MQAATLEIIRHALTLDHTVPPAHTHRVLTVCENPHKDKDTPSWRRLTIAECCQALRCNKNTFHRRRREDERYKALTVIQENGRVVMFRSDEIERLLAGEVPA